MSDNNNNTVGPEQAGASAPANAEASASATVGASAPTQQQTQYTNINMDLTNSEFNLKTIINKLKENQITDIFLPIKYFEYGIKSLLILKSFKLKYIFIFNILTHLILLLISFVGFTRVQTLAILLSLIYTIITLTVMIFWRTIKSKFNINLPKDLHIQPIPLKYKKVYKSERLDKLK